MDIQEENIPEELVCPITQLLFEDPVVCTDGHTYERTQIQMWFASHNISPLTGIALQNKILIPNYAIKKSVNAYIEKHPLLLKQRQQKADHQFALKLSQMSLNQQTPFEKGSLAQKQYLREKLDIQRQKQIYAQEKQYQYKRRIQARQKQLDKEKNKEIEIRKAIQRQRQMQALLRAEQNKTKKLQQKIKSNQMNQNKQIRNEKYYFNYTTFNPQNLRMMKGKKNQQFYQKSKQIAQINKLKDQSKMEIDQVDYQYQRSIEKLMKQKDNEISIIREYAQTKQDQKMQIEAVQYRYQGQIIDLRQKKDERIDKLQKYYQRKIKFIEQKSNEIKKQYFNSNFKIKEQEKSKIQKDQIQKDLKKQQKQQRLAQKQQQKLIKQKQKQERKQERARLNRQRQIEKEQQKMEKQIQKQQRKKLKQQYKLSKINK